jgi:hypothetical protein
VLARIWPEDSKRAATTYPGRSLRLYVDPEVSYGTEQTGGIRVNAASHIGGPVTGSIVSGRNKRAAFRVEPLRSDPPAAGPAPLATVLSAIPRGEAKLTPEALEAVREPFAILEDTDLNLCPEPMVRAYFSALAAAVRVA